MSELHNLVPVSQCLTLPILCSMEPLCNGHVRDITSLNDATRKGICEKCGLLHEAPLKVDR